jgi:hypothetical protein
MILPRANKAISFLLALAVLLMPFELAFAHQADEASSAVMHTAAEQLSKQHQAASGFDRHVMSMSDHNGQCDGHGTGMCKHCVYCSPVVSATVILDIETPSVVPPANFVIADYSIDLPSYIRPPKQL